MANNVIYSGTNELNGSGSSSGSVAGGGNTTYVAVDHIEIDMSALKWKDNLSSTNYNSDFVYHADSNMLYFYRYLNNNQITFYEFDVDKNEVTEKVFPTIAATTTQYPIMHYGDIHFTYGNYIIFWQYNAKFIHKLNVKTGNIVTYEHDANIIQIIPDLNKTNRWYFTSVSTTNTICSFDLDTMTFTKLYGATNTNLFTINYLHSFLYDENTLCGNSMGAGASYDSGSTMYGYELNLLTNTFTARNLSLAKTSSSGVSYAYTGTSYATQNYLWDDSKKTFYCCYTSSSTNGSSFYMGRIVYTSSSAKTLSQITGITLTQTGSKNFTFLTNNKMAIFNVGTDYGAMKIYKFNDDNGYTSGNESGPILFAAPGLNATYACSIWIPNKNKFIFSVNRSITPVATAVSLGSKLLVYTLRDY